MKLSEIRALCAAATPGPWYGRLDLDCYQGGRYIGVGPYQYDRAGNRTPCGVGDAAYFETDVCRVEHDEDEAFILTARSLLPLLLAVAERAQTAMDGDFGTPSVHALQEALEAVEAYKT